MLSVTRECSPKVLEHLYQLQCESLHSLAMRTDQNFSEDEVSQFWPWLFIFILAVLRASAKLFHALETRFCRKKQNQPNHLKMFPFVKIDIFVLRWCSRSTKIFKSLTRLVCESSIISINNFSKGNIFILTITSQQLFLTIENLKILYAAVIAANNAIFNE